MAYPAVNLCGILEILNKQLWKPENNFNNRCSTIIMAQYSVWENTKKYNREKGVCNIV